MIFKSIDDLLRKTRRKDMQVDYRNKDGAFLPPDGSMDAMMLHFHEMYHSATKAGFSKSESLQLVLEALKTGMAEGIRSQAPPSPAPNYKAPCGCLVYIQHMCGQGL